MELRNYKSKLLNKLNLTIKKEEIEMELRNKVVKQLDVVREILFNVESYIETKIEDRRRKYPKGFKALTQEEKSFNGSRYTSIGTFEGVEVIYSPAFMLEMNAAFGAFFSANTEELDFIDERIIVDHNFIELSTNGKRFVLLHELGHSYDPRGRDELMNDFLQRPSDQLTGIVNEAEKFADDYAVKRMGRRNVIRAIEETKSFFFFQSHYGAQEMENRIQRLKKKGWF